MKLKFFKYLPVALCILFSGIITAGAQQAGRKETVRAEGYGDNRYLAVIEAVKDALMQSEGVSLASIDGFSKQYTGEFSTENGKESDKEKFEEKFATALTAKTEGKVAGYKVISTDKGDDSKWHAVLDVYLWKIKDTNPNRLKIAVVPFKIHNDYTIEGTDINGKAVAQRLSQRIVTDLTQSRRFSVIDREYDKEYADEKGVLRSGDAAPSELIKLGQLLGVDYLVVGMIEEFSCKTETSYNSYSKRTLATTAGTAVVSYRVLVMATRQIKWSDTVRLNLGDLQDVGLKEAVDTGITSISAQINDQLIENIYPAKIVDIDEETGEIIVNRGGKNIYPGQKFTVMKISEKPMLDPDTGESLGFKEMPIGIIEVTRVEAKVSYAKIVQGKTDTIKRNYIIRKIQN